MQRRNNVVLYSVVTTVPGHGGSPIAVPVELPRWGPIVPVELPRGLDPHPPINDDICGDIAQAPSNGFLWIQLALPYTQK